jgi:hypothetical protein
MVNYGRPRTQQIRPRKPFRTAGVRAFAIAGLSTLGDRQAIDSRRGSEHSGRSAVAGPVAFASQALSGNVK